jgi:hypothetical protein
MKSFREFITEADKWSDASGTPASGGGMSVDEIDARKDLTPAQKAKLKARRTKVPGSTVRGTTAKPSAAANVTKSLKGAQNVKTAAELGSAALKDAGRFGKIKGFIGKAATPVQVALDTGLEAAAQKQRGRKTGSSLAMGATKAAGGLAGMKAGAAGGAAIGTALGGPVGTAVGGVVGGIGGYMAGSGLAGKASEVVAGATGKEKAAMAQRQRKSQAGGGLSGIGGKTTFSKGKGGTAFMSTGVGKQRKTVQLDKTSVVRDAKGKEAVGHLAFKGGKAVYKRAADPSTLARTSSNPFERIGRSLFAGAYKKQDEAQKQKALAKARQSDVKRQQKLGVKMKPAG